MGSYARCQRGGEGLVWVAVFVVGVEVDGDEASKSAEMYGVEGVSSSASDSAMDNVDAQAHHD